MFGDYIDIYDLTRAVEDGATVKIFYESRLAKVELSPEDYAALDAEADKITEQVEESEAAKAKSRWSRLEAIVGAEDRLDLIAADIVQHWEKRRERPVRQGHDRGDVAGASPCGSTRRSSRLRPDWHSDDPATGQDQGRHDRVRRRPAGFPGPSVHQGRP